MATRPKHPKFNVPFDTSEFNSKALYDIYTVSIKMRERLYGGTPKTKKMLEKWIESRTKHSDDLTRGQIEAAVEVMGEEATERSWMGFQEDSNGLFIDTNNIKAMLKQGGSMLGLFMKKRGTKQIMCEGMEVKSLDGGTRLYFEREEPDGYIEKPIHVMTAQGPRTAIKRADFLEDVKLSFEVWVLTTSASEVRHVGRAELVHVLTFSQENGLGADRSQGAGKFDVIDFQRVQGATASVPHLPKMPHGYKD